MENKYFVNLDTAKKLKQAGYREVTDSYYYMSSVIRTGSPWEGCIPRPTLMEALEWIQTHYYAYIEYKVVWSDNAWKYVVEILHGMTLVYVSGETMEDVLNEAICKLIVP